MNDEIEWIETRLGHKNAPDHVVCSRCHAFLPVAQFKRKKWNTSGHYVVEIVSSLCSGCRGPAKKAAKATVRALKKQIALGQINEVVGKRALDALILKNRGARIQRLAERVGDARAGEYASVIGAIVREKRMAAVRAAQLPAGDPFHTLRLPYFSAYYEILKAVHKRIRSELTLDRYRERRQWAEIHPHWRDYMTDEERDAMLAVYTPLLKAGGFATRSKAPNWIGPKAIHALQAAERGMEDEK